MSQGVACELYRTYPSPVQIIGDKTHQAWTAARENERGRSEP